jgi:hypothetical protein
MSAMGLETQAHTPVFFNGVDVIYISYFFKKKIRDWHIAHLSSFPIINGAFHN